MFGVAHEVCKMNGSLTGTLRIIPLHYEIGGNDLESILMKLRFFICIKIDINHVTITLKSH